MISLLLSSVSASAILGLDTGPVLIPTVVHTYQGIATTTSGAFTFPGGHLQKDDILIFAETWDGDVGGTTLPGWTLQTSDTGSAPSYKVFWTVVGATPPTSITPQRANVRDTAWAIYVIRGGKYGSAPVQTHVRQSGNSASVLPPAYTVEEDDSLVICFGFLDDDPGVFDTFPTGFTNTLTQSAALGAESNAVLGMAALEQQPAGLITPTAFSGTGLSDSWWAVTLAIKPVVIEPDLTVSDVSSSTIFGPSADILVSDVSSSTIFGPSADIFVSDVSSTTVFGPSADILISDVSSVTIYSGA